MLDPDKIFQTEFATLVEEIASEARPECQDTIRRRLTKRGHINDRICGLAMDRTRDRFADAACRGAVN